MGDGSAAEKRVVLKAALKPHWSVRHKRSGFVLSPALDPPPVAASESSVGAFVPELMALLTCLSLKRAGSIAERL